MDNKVTENKEERLEKDDILGAMLPDVAEEVASEISPNDAEADILSAESVASVETGIQSATETQTDGGDKKVEAPVRESRVKKTLLNARVNLIFYFLNLILSFFTRKIFLDCLGTEFMGLTGTLQNLLGFLNLAELGIGGAIGFLLYKPLFDRNQQKINEIISVMGYLYRWIGIIILGGGVIMSCFLPLIFPDTGFNLALIYFAFYSFLASSLIGYFINYRQNLLGADQKNYVVAAYFQTGNIVKTIIQMALAYYTGSYYLWVAIELAFGIIYSVILNWKINKTYPWLAADVRLGKRMFKKYPEVMKKSVQVFFQRVGVIGITQSTNFLIYGFVNLSMVALYGNYMLLMEKTAGLIRNFTSSLTASVGNLIAEGHIDKTRKIYFELFGLYVFVGGAVAFPLMCYTGNFIQFWLGGKYIIQNWIMMPAFVLIYLEFISSSSTQFIFGFGKFGDFWATILECVLYLCISVAFGAKYGLFGVLLGRTLSSFIINLGWKPYYLFSRGLKLKLKRYWFNLLPMVLIQFLIGYLLYINRDCLTGSIHSFIELIINGIVITIIYIIVTAVGIYIINTGFRNFINGRILSRFKNGGIINIKR